MLFSSIEFIFIFLPAALGFYFLTPRRYKNLTLLIFSLVFYGWGEPLYLFLMVFTILLDYFLGLLIDKKRQKAKLWLWIAVASNLGILAVFKYLAPLLDAFDIGFFALALPVGISFYTFQSLSYVIDVYRGAEAQKSPIDFGAYITMFPQLVAGPIVKYSQVSEQLSSRTHDVKKAASGIGRFVCGLSKKLIFANGAGEIWSWFSSLPRDEISTLGAWIGIIFFAFQIYFDFSGYSDMAIGLGLILGFDFPENFNYPYTATGIKDFWQRWHISLSGWFKEYLYIPLGGNRKSAVRTVLNLLAVWTATGLWHGAGLNFIVWGLYYFFALTLERFLIGRFLKKAPVFSRFYTAVIVLVGWVFFASNGIYEAFSYLASMFTFTPVRDFEIYHILRNLPFLIILALGSTDLPKKAYLTLAKDSGKRQFAFSMGGIAVFILCIAELVGSAYNPFLYFRF